MRKTTAAGLTWFATGVVSGSQTDGFDDVSKREATQIAKASVGEIGTRDEFEDWSTEGIQSPALFHAKLNTDGSRTYVPRAWVFPIDHRGEDVGYITIDAKQRHKPVLAYGRGNAPQHGLNDAAGLAESEAVSIRGRYLYHGGVEYGVETADKTGIVDLRGSNGKKPIRRFPAVERIEQTLPVDTNGDGGDPPDWEGPANDRITGVPNWESTDPGAASETKIGTGDDSWDTWDGCSLIAGSMAIGYHEDISENDNNERESVIDRLHNSMGVSDEEYTDPRDVDDGIRNYDAEGHNSYSADNNWLKLKGNIEDAVAGNKPPILSMLNGPYIKKSVQENGKWADGHSVVPVGYRYESCGPVCSNLYIKVHSGYDTPPDRISHGNWLKAVITRISKE